MKKHVFEFYFEKSIVYQEGRGTGNVTAKR